MFRRHFLVASALAAPAVGRAQSWPSGRVTLVVPFPAGAATDLGARLDAAGWSPRLMSPDEFASFTRSEKERWGAIIRRANMRLE